MSRCTGPRCDDLAHVPPCELAGIETDRPLIVKVKEPAELQEARRIAEAAFAKRIGWMRKWNYTTAQMVLSHEEAEAVRKLLTEQAELRERLQDALTWDDVESVKNGIRLALAPVEAAAGSGER